MINPPEASPYSPRLVDESSRETGIAKTQPTDDAIRQGQSNQPALAGGILAAPGVSPGYDGTSDHQPSKRATEVSSAAPPGLLRSKSIVDSGLTPGAALRRHLRWLIDPFPFASSNLYSVLAQSVRLRSSLLAFVLTVLSFLIAASPLVTHSQSGRQKPATPSPSPISNTRPRQTAKPTSQQGNTQASSKSGAKEESSDESTDVVRVTSNLVAVPTTVVDSRGVAVTNLKLEDFELKVDGQLNAISEISRADTPVRMAMLFDNSGSLSASREFEKRAAIKFFRNVLRPIDQAAVFSVATDVTLAEPLTNDARRLELTIDAFGKPEGATSLFDGIIQAGAYLKPYPGRRVIVIVSDGEDTTSRADFDLTLQRALADDCQIYVVQTGLYENANVRALAAERRMEEFAAQTGGAVYVPKTAEELDEAFAQISADLAQQYILSYYPAQDKRDGKYHLIGVSVKTRPNARVRARKGFVVKVHDRV
jgi:Ca-activated chloride channel family protein